MTRYEDLAKLAADWSRRYDVHSEECKKFSYSMADSFATYLDAPPGRIEFVELDGNFRATGKLIGSGKPPEMMDGPDGFQYFGLSVMFKTQASMYFMSEQCAIGLQKGETGWIVMWNDTRYNVPFSDLSKIDLFFSDWTKMSFEMYKGPITRSSKAIGFVPSR